MVRDLRVYVWPQFEESTAEYTGFAVAIAHTLEDAIAMVEEECHKKYDAKRWGDVEVYDIKQLACVCHGSG